MKWDVFSDTWVATDAVGRSLPGFEECGAPKEDRFVGLFYFLTHGQHGTAGPYDVSKILAADPDNPKWEKGAHFWGEPEIGYYFSTDRWVIRRHGYMLADAGVDTLIFDTTNDWIYPPAWTAICETFQQMRAEGENTPQVCFLASKESIRKLWDELYSKGLFADLWFKWKGKPLLLFGQQRGMPAEAEFPQHIRDFFTLRASWAWDSLPWYGQDGYHRWPWVAHHPQVVGWDTPCEKESVPVAVGQHPLSYIGRSFHDGHQPDTDRYDLTPYTHLGLHFEEQWQRALAVDPKFIFVTGWNEWTAGAVICDTTDENSLWKRWDFFPGARIGKTGRPLRLGDAYFIDQYNQEFSRDAEPMKGGHTDNYYYQMIAGIRRYKGVRPLPAASAAKRIDIGGSFAQWDDVMPEYRDHLYEALPHDEVTWESIGSLTDKTGRNEFVSLKVARDAETITFMAQTREPITPYENPGWMMLFINADQKPETGWFGYDYVVNYPVIDGERTTVCKNDRGWFWNPVGEARYRVEGNRLMISLPRALLGMKDKPLSFDFHWADNIPCLGKIEEFFLYGDSAPNRRFNYRYRE